MPRMPRIHIKGALEYVTCRGDNERDLFHHPEDYSMYLELLRKYQGKYNFKLFAFVLLPAHLHLLVELGGGVTISQVMHSLNSNYTKYFNGRYAQKGHLFQERYRLVIVEKCPYLSLLTAYIHRNPSILGLVNDPIEYPYSSCAYYFQKGAVRVEVVLPIIAREEVLESLQGRDYQEVLRTPVGEQLGFQFHRKAIVGSEEFIAEVQSQIGQQKVPSVSHRKRVWTGSLAAVTLGILTMGFYSTTIGVREHFRRELDKKETELQSRISQERTHLLNNINEKYRADEISYEAMTKRLELEKNKIRTLGGERIVTNGG